MFTCRVYTIVSHYQDSSWSVNGEVMVLFIIFKLRPKTATLFTWKVSSQNSVCGILPEASQDHSRRQSEVKDMWSGWINQSQRTKRAIFFPGNFVLANAFWPKGTRPLTL